MARVKFSGLVTSINGSIGGTTFQRNGYGFTVKNKPNIVNPRKASQIPGQNNVAWTSSQWQGLDETDREAWRSWAQSFPVPSRLNPDSNLNGFNYFQKYHLLNKQSGIGGVLDNPNGLKANFTNFGVVVESNGSNLLVQPSIDTVNTSFRIIVYLTPPINPSQVFIPYTPRNVGAVVWSPGLELDVTTAYINAFGYLPTSGDKLGVRIVAVNQVAGQWFDTGVFSGFVDAI